MYDRQRPALAFIDINLKQRNLKVNIQALVINSFKPEFIIVIFIHYKPRIAVAIPDF